jgi:hypothetical protein
MEDAMKHSGILFLMVLTLVVIPCLSLAEKPSEVFTVIHNSMGLGNDTCGKLKFAFSQTPSNKQLVKDGVPWPSQSHAYLQWVYGFISAINMVHNQTKNLYGDSYGISAWLEKYCSDHPMESVSEAAWFLVYERTGYMLGKEKNH